MATRRMGGGAADRALTQIDNILAAGGPEAKKLWDILTALRGPDDRTQQGFKASTTEIIRSAAFPAVARKVAQGGRIDFSASFASTAAPQAVKTGYTNLFGTHFGSHVALAVVALGLDLDTRDPEQVAQAARIAAQRAAAVAPRPCDQSYGGRW